jgi:hypothetical protein
MMLCIDRLSRIPLSWMRKMDFSILSVKKRILLFPLSFTGIVTDCSFW